MSPAPIRYVSADEDSARWNGFPFRSGDIVISTRSKSGTTWLQMICALVVFQTPDLPDRLGRISPWVDHEVSPIEDVVARLEAQQHRRFVKTHTPLDGIPLDDRATYIVVGRHPLDMAVSLWHQSQNIDRRRVSELTGQPIRESPTRPLHEWLRRWIAKDVDPREEMDSLPGVMHHLSDAWERRDAPNIVLVHYDALQQDLHAEMNRLAELLEIEVPDTVWPTLVEAATFDEMRANSDVIAPNSGGILKDPAAFFKRGRSGSGVEALSSDEVNTYLDRATQLAPADMLAWLHRSHDD
jgi:aryl sulfotransferase